MLLFREFVPVSLYIALSFEVYCLNSAAAITQSRDKLYSLQLLLHSGVGFLQQVLQTLLDTNDLIKWLVDHH
jgi:glutathione synthase/RimK-type ligase-like ATP-grasp enzyme